MPIISVIIPLYNKGPHIAHTLGSVLDQTLTDFEVIIVDDGSKDNGADVVKQFNDPRIRLFQQENRGVSYTRNRGVELASADLIAFLDADDEMMPSHLEALVRLNRKFPDAGMYTTAFKVQVPGGKARWADYKFIPDPPWEGLLENYFRSASLGGAPVITSTMGLTKKIFFEFGGFSVKSINAEDHDLWGKIALKYPVAFSWDQNAGTIYHADAVNHLTAMYPQEFPEDFVISARNALDKGEVKTKFIEPLIEYINMKEIHRASKNIFAGNPKLARSILKPCKTKWFYKQKLILYILSLVPYSLLQLLRKQKYRLIKQ